MSAERVDAAVAEALGTLEEVAQEFREANRSIATAVEEAANQLRRARFHEKENYHRWQEAKNLGQTATLRHKAGKCPVCRGYLWADVTVEVSTSEPTIGDDGRASASAYAQTLAANIEAHACDKREPLPDWEAELLSDPLVGPAVEAVHAVMDAAATFKPDGPKPCPVARCVYTAAACPGHPTTAEEATNG